MTWEWVVMIAGLSVLPIVVFGAFYAIERVVGTVGRAIDKIKGED